MWTMEVATNDILQQKLLPKSVMKDIELKVGVKGKIFLLASILQIWFTKW